MKYPIAGVALLIGMAGTAYCQGSGTASERGPVHPGTALLDSMGIYAGTPQVAQRPGAQTASSATSDAAPNTAPGKQP